MSRAFMLAKDGAVTSILALAILVSVLARRPLMTAGMRPFVCDPRIPGWR